MRASGRGQARRILVAVQPGVVAAQAQQLLVIALLDDAPLIQHEDAVMANRAFILPIHWVETAG